MRPCQEMPNTFPLFCLSVPWVLRLPQLPTSQQPFQNCLPWEQSVHFGHL